MANWVFSQGRSNQVTNTSIPLAFLSPVTKNNLLLVVCGWSNATTFVSLADTANNTWTQIGGEVNNGSQLTRFFYANANANTTPTVTLTINASVNIRIGIFEYSAPAIWSFDANSAAYTNGGASTTIVNVGPVVTINDGDLIVNLMNLVGARTYTDTATPTFTPRNNGAIIVAADLIGTNSKGSYSDTGTLSASTVIAAELVSFKLPVSGGGGFGSLGLGVGLGPMGKYDRGDI